MARYSRNRFVPIVLVVVIMIIAIVALVSLARAIFFSDGPTTSEQQTDTSRQALLSTAVDRSVRMTIRGPIVADERFNSYRINISPSARSLTTHQGYLGQTIDEVNLGNNVPAYDEFVHALDKANLTVGQAFTGEDDDTRGICASGRIYEYEILHGSTVIKRLWTSTCKGSPGSLRASTEQLTNLFTAQIPDARTPLGKISL